MTSVGTPLCCAWNCSVVHTAALRVSWVKGGVPLVPRPGACPHLSRHRLRQFPVKRPQCQPNVVPGSHVASCVMQNERGEHSTACARLYACVCVFVQRGARGWSARTTATRLSSHHPKSPRAPNGSRVGDARMSVVKKSGSAASDNVDMTERSRPTAWNSTDTRYCGLLPERWSPGQHNALTETCARILASLGGRAAVHMKRTQRSARGIGVSAPARSDSIPCCRATKVTQVRCAKTTHLGWCTNMTPSMNSTLLSSHARSMSLRSDAFTAAGFSHSTCLPLLAACAGVRL